MLPAGNYLLPIHLLRGTDSLHASGLRRNVETRTEAIDSWNPTWPRRKHLKSQVQYLWQEERLGWPCATGKRSTEVGAFWAGGLCLGVWSGWGSIACSVLGVGSMS